MKKIVHKIFHYVYSAWQIKLGIQLFSSKKKTKKKSQVMYIRAAIENKSAGGNN